MSWKSIFWYVFAVRGGYGNAAALADAYHLAMGALRRIAVVSGFLMIACVVARWEDGPNHVTGPLFAFSSVVLVLSMGLLALLTARWPGEHSGGHNGPEVHCATGE